jgi:hypothetical protein
VANVPLTMPVQAGRVVPEVFERRWGADRLLHGGAGGNSTLNQASYVYQERIVFRPMNPVR